MIHLCLCYILRLYSTLFFFKFFRRFFCGLTKLNRFNRLRNLSFPLRFEQLIFVAISWVIQRLFSGWTTSLTACSVWAWPAAWSTDLALNIRAHFAFQHIYLRLHFFKRMCEYFLRMIYLSCLDVMSWHADCFNDLLGETETIRCSLQSLGYFFKVKFVMFVILPNQCD